MAGLHRAHTPLAPSVGTENGGGGMNEVDWPGGRMRSLEKREGRRDIFRGGTQGESGCRSPLK